MTSLLFSEKNILDVVKYKWVYVTISLCLIIPGVIAMLYSSFNYPTHAPLRLGVDFTGGSMLQYAFNQKLDKEDVTTIRNGLKEQGIENPVIQIQEALTITDAAKEKAGFEIKSIASIRTRFLETSKNKNEVAEVSKMLDNNFEKLELLQVNAIGPTLSKELFKNAMVALLLAFIGIVGYLTIRFQFDYAMFALFALFHDALFVCGVFSILGLFFATQIDSLFITAILTVIGFSVHDTIVVFDRIRENSRFLAKKKTFNDIVNASVNQTLARSINTSITTLITLTALYFLGGETTKDFVLAMILGIAIGTYSSIFFASMFLAMWRNRSSLKKQFA